MRTEWYMRIDRRSMLGILASGSLGLAGCLSSALPGTDSETPTDDAGQFELGDETIETTESSCAGPDDERAEINVGEETIQISGHLSAPNPCHEAVLNTVQITSQELVVVVGVVSTLEADEVCVECVGGIEYSATIEVSNASALNKITVDHETGGEFYQSPE